MEKRRKEEMRKTKVSSICLLLLVLIQLTTPSSAENNTSAAPPGPAALRYITSPADVTVAVGEPAVFRCGVPKASPNLTFTFSGSQGNYNLSCPYDHVEDLPKALYGSCDTRGEESLAVWTLKGTSFSDNGTKVECRQSNNTEALTAVLRVYDNGTSYNILIGCAIGGFFGMLLVAGLAYLLLQRSETVQKCFRPKETEEDLDTIVAKN